jgi:hypothetical protein
MVGKGAKWSRCEGLPDWDRDISEEGKVIKWKSPRFMAKMERRGAVRVKGILKKVLSDFGISINWQKEREKMEKEDDGTGIACEPLIVQRLIYKGEK